MQLVLDQKDRARKAGIELSTTIQRGGGRGKWKENKTEEAIFKKIVQGMEERERLLQVDT